ncbi:mucin-5AC-like [Lytechinus variegatus]|uniref:mucin-5AC-like n=1 Tax=Lytechinus variegatus TaxID=7654 RepID=UPI001BB1AC77|nr:mucin-5AC-like [Lytechinus variegatus]
MHISRCSMEIISYRMRSFFSTVLFLQILTDVTRPQWLEECPSNWLEFNSHCYFFDFNTSVNWSEARNQCGLDVAGADLLVMETEGELMFINGIISPPFPLAYLWIGLTGNYDSDGRYYWITGVELLDNVSYWEYGQPNNYFGMEHCVDLLAGDYKAHGVWRDVWCGARQGFICEKERETSVSTTIAPSTEESNHHTFLTPGTMLSTLATPTLLERTLLTPYVTKSTSVLPGYSENNWNLESSLESTKLAPTYGRNTSPVVGSSTINPDTLYYDGTTTVPSRYTWYTDSTIQMVPQYDTSNKEEPQYSGITSVRPMHTDSKLGVVPIYSTSKGEPRDMRTTSVIPSYIDNSFGVVPGYSTSTTSHEPRNSRSTLVTYRHTNNEPEVPFYSTIITGSTLVSPKQIISTSIVNIYGSSVPASWVDGNTFPTPSYDGTRDSSGYGEGTADTSHPVTFNTSKSTAIAFHSTPSRNFESTLLTLSSPETPKGQNTVAPTPNTLSRHITLSVSFQTTRSKHITSVFTPVSGAGLSKQRSDELSTITDLSSLIVFLTSDLSSFLSSPSTQRPSGTTSDVIHTMVKTSPPLPPIATSGRIGSSLNTSVGSTVLQSTKALSEFDSGGKTARPLSTFVSTTQSAQDFYLSATSLLSSSGAPSVTTLVTIPELTSGASSFGGPNLKTTSWITIPSGSKISHSIVASGDSLQTLEYPSTCISPTRTLAVSVSTSKYPSISTVPTTHENRSVHSYVLTAFPPENNTSTVKSTKDTMTTSIAVSLERSTTTSLPKASQSTTSVVPDPTTSMPAMTSSLAPSSPSSSYPKLSMSSSAFSATSTTVDWSTEQSTPLYISPSYSLPVTSSWTPTPSLHFTTPPSTSTNGRFLGIPNTLSTDPLISNLTPTKIHAHSQKTQLHITPQRSLTTTRLSSSPLDSPMHLSSDGSKTEIEISATLTARNIILTESIDLKSSRTSIYPLWSHSSLFAVSSSIHYTSDIIPLVEHSSLTAHDPLSLIDSSSNDASGFFSSTVIVSQKISESNFEHSLIFNTSSDIIPTISSSFIQAESLIDISDTQSKLEFPTDYSGVEESLQDTMAHSLTDAPSRTRGLLSPSMETVVSNSQSGLISSSMVDTGGLSVPSSPQYSDFLTSEATIFTSNPHAFSTSGVIRNRSQTPSLTVAPDQNSRGTPYSKTVSIQSAVQLSTSIPQRLTTMATLTTIPSSTSTNNVNCNPYTPGKTLPTTCTSTAIHEVPTKDPLISTTAQNVVCMAEIYAGQRWEETLMGHTATTQCLDNPYEIITRLCWTSGIWAEPDVHACAIPPIGQQLENLISVSYQSTVQPRDLPRLAYRLSRSAEELSSPYDVTEGSSLLPAYVEAMQILSELPSRVDGCVFEHQLEYANLFLQAVDALLLRTNVEKWSQGLEAGEEAVKLIEAVDTFAARTSGNECHLTLDPTGTVKTFEGIYQNIGMRYPSLYVNA